MIIYYQHFYIAVFETDNQTFCHILAIFYSNTGFEKWMKLAKVDRDTEVQGEVHLEATLVEENWRKRVKLKVVEARWARISATQDINCQIFLYFHGY